MADYLPKYIPASAVSFTASAAVTGGRLVVVTGDELVGPAGADSPAVAGVAGFDAVSGERVLVFTRVGGVQRLTAAGPIAAGAKVSSAAAGKVQSAGVYPIGIALTAAAADNDVIEVLFL